VSDPGAARQRTRLAWQRTSISFLALGGLLLRLGLSHRSAIEAAAAGTALLTGAALALRAEARSVRTSVAGFGLLVGCVLVIGGLSIAGALGG
jgi:uncharacterized membrane protein YidH (DUF202 family)